MNLPGSINFCVRCGSKLKHDVIFGRTRPVCPSCGWIFFSDPKVAVAVLVMKDNQVLLVQRINPPYQGFWTLPAGFMDGDEEPGDAARRECLEETGLIVETGELLELVSGREHEQGADIVLVFHAKLTSGKIQAGDDAAKAEFFPLDSLPPLAFKATWKTLEKLKNESKTS